MRPNSLLSHQKDKAIMVSYLAHAQGVPRATITKSISGIVCVVAERLRAPDTSSGASLSPGHGTCVLEQDNLP